jgi:hypothetical protein
MNHHWIDEWYYVVSLLWHWPHLQQRQYEPLEAQKKIVVLRVIVWRSGSWTGQLAGLGEGKIVARLQIHAAAQMVN